MGTVRVRFFKKAQASIALLEKKILYTKRGQEVAPHKPSDSH
jgi:hypothetical protein